MAKAGSMKREFKDPVEAFFWGWCFGTGVIAAAFVGLLLGLKVF